MCFTDTKCLGEEDREREEKKQRMSKVAALNYHTVLPCSTCASRQKKKRDFWNHWCNLLASTKPSVTSQRLRTWKLWMKRSVCTVGSGTATRKHLGQAESVKLRLYLLPLPTPRSQAAHQIYVILCWPSSTITSCDINHTAWALSMQGNTAKGDSDQIFYSQINSLSRSLPLPLSLLPSSGNWDEPGSSIRCWLLEGPRGVKSLCKPSVGSWGDCMISQQSFVFPGLLLSLSEELAQWKKNRSSLKNVLAHLSWTSSGEEVTKNGSAVNFEVPIC